MFEGRSRFSATLGAHERKLKGGERLQRLRCVQLVCDAAGEKQNVILKCSKQNRDEEIFKCPAKHQGNLFGNVP